MKELLKRLIKIIRKKEIIPIITPVENFNLLNEKVIFVLGGTGGIGLAIVKELLNSGAKVIIGGTNEEKLRSVSQMLDSDSVRTIVLDIKDISSFDDKIQQIVLFFGKLDAFINSAGVHTENVSFEKMTEKEFDRVIDVNLKGDFFLSQKISLYMINNSVKGHILLISSSRGDEPAWTPYGISKWGLNGFVKGLAQNLLPHGIIVNGIAPGPTATTLVGYKNGESIYSEENSLGRLATVEEVAVFAKYLISDVGNMTAGEIIHVSAGRGLFDIR